MRRKVELSMDELKKYETIKYLADHPDGNKDRAALILNCTKRHINRMLAGYRKDGKAFFIHGNKGRKPSTTIPDSVRHTVVDLYRTKYFGANFQHFTELLAEHEDIHLCVSSVSKILEAHYILSPKVTRAKKNRVKKELLAKKKNAASKKDSDSIQTNLVAVEDAHSRRPRCAYFGEMQQMDATPFEWIPGQVWHLHLAIDDATGSITGAWFDTQETLNGYYHVFHQILKNYGIPYKFLTDRRTVFTYKQKNTSALDEDTYTQFAYACKQLGVELDCTSIPQAKGRVERMFQTLQSRLPLELRLAGVTSLKTANEFLNSYIKEFNAKFALPINSSKSVFETQPSDEKINQILSVLTQRTIDSGHCIQHHKHYYRLLDQNGFQVHYKKGTKALLIESYDEQKFCCVNDTNIYVLEEIPMHQAKSKDLDVDYMKHKPKKQNIPATNHPWRLSGFLNFAKKQQHRFHFDTVTETA